MIKQIRPVDLACFKREREAQRQMDKLSRDAIALTSAFRLVSVNFDKVLAGRPYGPCTVTKIRPTDLSKLKIERQAQREVDIQSRDSGSHAAPLASSGKNQ